MADVLEEGYWAGVAAASEKYAGLGTIQGKVAGVRSKLLKELKHLTHHVGHHAGHRQIHHAVVPHETTRTATRRHAKPQDVVVKRKVGKSA